MFIYNFFKDLNRDAPISVIQGATVSVIGELILITITTAALNALGFTALAFSYMPNKIIAILVTTLFVIGLLVIIEKISLLTLAFFAVAISED